MMAVIAPTNPILRMECFHPFHYFRLLLCHMNNATHSQNVLKREIEILFLTRTFLVCVVQHNEMRITIVHFEGLPPSIKSIF
jgi:hypothetical protein